MSYVLNKVGTFFRCAKIFYLTDESFATTTVMDYPVVTMWVAGLELYPVGFLLIPDLSDISLIMLPGFSL